MGFAENLFREQIWIPDDISFHLAGRTVYFKEENFLFSFLATVTKSKSFVTIVEKLKKLCFQ